MTLSNWMLIAVAAAIAVIGGFLMMAPNSFWAGDGKLYADLTDQDQIVAGRLVYAEQCAECHGVRLQGQKNWRQPLPEGGLPAPPHDETGHTWHHSDQQNFAYTKLGGEKIAPPGFKSNMPGFSDILTDAQIWAVLTFIKSKWPVNIQRRQARLNQQAN